MEERLTKCYHCFEGSEVMCFFNNFTTSLLLALAHATRPYPCDCLISVVSVENSVQK